VLLVVVVVLLPDEGVVVVLPDEGVVVVLDPADPAGVVVAGVVVVVDIGSLVLPAHTEVVATASRRIKIATF